MSGNAKQKKKMTKVAEIDPRITPQSKRQAHIHYIIAFCGGFLGVFPIVNVIGLLGSAQTSNLIECVHSVIGQDWIALCQHAAGVALYVLATFLVTYLSHHTKLNIKLLALFVDVATGFVMWRMPDNLPELFYLYPTFFALSFQWCSFSGGYGYNCSTIFSTNNLRQCVSAFTETYFNGKREFKLKAIFYGATLVAFHLGVAAAFLAWYKIGNICFPLIVLPCGLAAFLVVSPVKNIGSLNSESEQKIAEKSSAELKSENSVKLGQKSKSEK